MAFIIRSGHRGNRDVYFGWPRRLSLSRLTNTKGAPAHSAVRLSLQPHVSAGNPPEVCQPQTGSRAGGRPKSRPPAGSTLQHPGGRTPVSGSAPAFPPSGPPQAPDPLSGSPHLSRGVRPQVRALALALRWPGSDPGSAPAPLLFRLPQAPVPLQAASSLQSPAPAVGIGCKTRNTPIRSGLTYQGSDKAERSFSGSPQVPTAMPASVALEVGSI
ncbi:hypothetical protein NDU88_002792 [Pleurodeles waltl]|uniref:Uncharacterized protein n=1 Tax=Pleurodeles waltl TaxID=8319 RepID=A0AAV7PA48_PLEWA|nr:hypothetical protein NDU88_002792 [Pleurodeles waltl]